METDKKLVEAVDLSLEVWQELAEVGNGSKYTITPSLYNKIKGMMCHCPLCEYYKNKIMSKEIAAKDMCTTCPIGNCMVTPSPYFRWSMSTNKNARKKYAKTIVNMLVDWRENNGTRD